MSETKELTTLPPKESAMDVYTTENGLEPYIQQIIDHCEQFEPNIETVKGRKEVASMTHKIAKAKVALDNIGKELVADLKELPKKIDAERKRMRDRLEALQDEVRAPLTAWENAEEARIQRHKDALSGIDAIVAMGIEESGAIRAQLAALDAIVVDESWEEFETEAAHVKAKAAGKLQEKLAARLKYEADQAELERLRKAEADRAQKEHEAKIAQEAADKARREAQAERDAAIQREANAKVEAETARLNAQLAEKQAELDRIAAAALAAQQVQEAADQAAAAERQRIADEKAAADAKAKRREANRAHCGRINRAALDALVKNGVPEDCAKKTIELIAKGKIPAVTIIY